MGRVLPPYLSDWTTDKVRASKSFVQSFIDVYLVSRRFY